MFGKRANAGFGGQAAGSRVAAAATVAEPPKAQQATSAPVQTERRSETYFQTKSLIFGALIEAIDLAALSKLDPESAREEIRDIVHEIVTIKNLVLSIAEQEDLLDDICNDVLGFGPLEPLLARDEIADIIVKWTDAMLHRSRRQDPIDQCPFPRQCAVDEHLPADREPGRTPRRRSLADLRRSSAGRLTR